MLHCAAARILKGGSGDRNGGKRCLGERGEEKAADDLSLISVSKVFFRAARHFLAFLCCTVLVDHSVNHSSMKIRLRLNKIKCQVRDFTHCYSMYIFTASTVPRK